MKVIRFLIAGLVLSTTVATAQNHRSNNGVQPEVIIVGESIAHDPEVYEYNTPEEVKSHIRAKRRADRHVKVNATEQIMEAAHIDEFKGTEAPLMIVSQKNNKFAFAVGGFINLRTSWDFDGLVQNTDFIPSLIPVQRRYNTHQQLIMDASTSRVYFQGVANTGAIGEVDIYVDMDFRGGVGYNDEGVTNSYRPRIRRAYVAFMGFTLGRDYTTFCDISAIPNTIDFQGPNALGFNYATLIRYDHSCLNDRLGMGIALEQPNVSGTYGDTFRPIPQRVPDVPAYIEYKMGENREHHVRVTGIIRDMYLNNAETNKNTSLLGWGTQLSGNVMPFKWMNLFFTGTYGEGITPYIQDIAGMGLDFTPNPQNANQIQTMPMFAWQASTQLKFSKRVSMNGGYSTVQVQKKNGYYSDDQYRKGDYIFANLFYDVTPRLQLACEYIYGSRENMSNADNHANRANLMAQFSF